MNIRRKMKLSQLSFELNLLADNYNRDWLERCINRLSNIKNEEEEYYNNIPIEFKYLYKGENSKGSLKNLNKVLNSLKEVPDMEDCIVQEINIVTAAWTLEDTLFL